jgi:Zn-dependent protease with chaperone function
MSAAVAAAVLGLVSVAALGPASALLERARWTWRAPRAAVCLWQCVGLAGATSAIGAGLAVAAIRYHDGLVGGLVRMGHAVVQGRPLAGLGLPDALGLTLAADIAVVTVAVVAASMVRTARARAQHRRLLDLVGSGAGAPPDAVLLDHPRATAYCLPGIRPRIVVSAGTLALLEDEELAAVLDHERAHAHAHHGLVLLPVTSFGVLFRWLPFARRAPRAVAGLLEMAADDYAARHHDPRQLASALLAMTTAGSVPACSLGATATAVPARVHRLLDDRRSSRPLAVAAGLGAVVAVAVPLAVVLVS